MNSNQAIKLVSEWYKFFYSNKTSRAKLTLDQIEYYEKLLKIKKNI